MQLNFKQISVVRKFEGGIVHQPGSIDNYDGIIIMMLLLSLSSFISFAALEQCVASDALGVSKFEGDTGWIPDNAIIATSYMSKREGNKGRLFHNSGKSHNVLLYSS